MLTTWQQQSSYTTLLLLFPSSLSFCCSFCSRCLPGYPHKITILSDCILRLRRAVPGVAFGSCRSAGQVEVAPSRLRLISICCRAKFMTVISKRRAANTFLMPHAESAARLFRASCRKPHEYLQSSEPQLLLPYAILLPACLRNLPRAVAMFTRPRQISL